MSADTPPRPTTPPSPPPPSSGTPGLAGGAWQYALLDQETGVLLELSKETLPGAIDMARNLRGVTLMPVRRWIGGWLPAALSTEENNG